MSALSERQEKKSTSFVGLRLRMTLPVLFGYCPRAYPHARFDSVIDTPAPSPPPPSARSRRLPLLLVAVAVILAGTFLGYKFLKARAARTREAAVQQSAQKAAAVSPEEARRLKALAEARALAASAPADIRDRNVTNEQKVKFVKTLKNAPRGNVVVYAMRGDRESFLYAAKVANLLRDAGFGAGEKSVDFVPASERPSGPTAVILIVSREVGIPKHAIAIKDALEIIGIRCEFVFRDSLERPKDVQICIFPKSEDR